MFPSPGSVREQKKKKKKKLIKRRPETALILEKKKGKERHDSPDPHFRAGPEDEGDKEPGEEGEKKIIEWIGKRGNEPKEGDHGIEPAGNPELPGETEAKQYETGEDSDKKDQPFFFAPERRRGTFLR